MIAAISNTLLAMGFNPELVDEYLTLAGKVELAQNRNRQAASWVTRAGLECAFYVGREYDGVAKVFDDIIGTSANYRIVNYGKSASEGFFPYRKMGEVLSELTGKPVYKQRAFELLVTLDVHLYKVERRIIVPANMGFRRLHKVLQAAFNWRDAHLHDFIVFSRGQRAPLLRLVPFEEDLEYDDEAVLIDGQSLADIFPEQDKIVYTYDFGDHWEREIGLVRILEECDRELPYLLEASGKTPPEDVGGTPGFLQFYEAFLNPDHPKHELYTNWARFWRKNLNERESTPRVIYV